MYLNFYQLDREPFHVTPDPAFWFSSRTHMEALAAIIYGIERRKGFIAVTGEVGLGKTTIVRNYLKRHAHDRMQIIYIYDSDISFHDLLTTVFQELGLGQRPKNVTKAIRRLYKQLIVSYRLDETVVLIIDEAQNLPIATLERLRMLSNLETSTDKLIQLVLIGQPEFNALLEDRRLRQLNQRIAIRTEIAPLGDNESVAYIKHRLEHASFGPSSVMDHRAMRLIARAAKGVPRQLNILCDNALITGFGYAARPVTARIVREIVQDRSSIAARHRRRSARAFVAGLFIAIALAIPLNELIGLPLSPTIGRILATVSIPTSTGDFKRASGWWQSGFVTDAKFELHSGIDDGSQRAERPTPVGPCDSANSLGGPACEGSTPLSGRTAAQR